MILLVGSLLLYLTDTDRMDFRVIFFPDESTGDWRGEERKIPHFASIEDAAYALIKEIILGPAKLRLMRALPKNTVLRSVLLREEILYVDFSDHLAVPENAAELSLETMIDGVKRTILYNFPSIEGVVVFVGGIEA